MLEKASHSLQEQEQEEQGMMLILKSKLKKKNIWRVNEATRQVSPDGKRSWKEGSEHGLGTQLGLGGLRSRGRGAQGVQGVRVRGTR